MWLAIAVVELRPFRNLHDREVLNSGDVLEPELDPDHNVLGVDIVVPRGPLPDARGGFVLVCVLPTREQLVGLELSNVDGVVGKAA